MFLRSLLLLAAAVAVQATPVAAQKFDPGNKYVCPNHSDSAIDCYLDAVTHLYTMCRHVKSIEIIEFGHAKAQEGVNGAKSEYCVDKQKLNITRPYQAALREATGYREAVEGLRTLQQFWLDALAALRWRDGEPGPAYEDRVNRVYEQLSWQIEDVRVGFTTAPDNAAPVKVAAPAKASRPAARPAAKPAARTTAN